MKNIAKGDDSYVAVRSDSVGSAAEFVRPLVAEIQREVQVPEVDLTNPETAAKSLQAIEATMKKLESYRERVSQIKTLLQQEKIDLEP